MITIITGKSFLNHCLLSPEDLWKELTKIAIKQGFKLGIRFTEPPISIVLDKIKEDIKQPVIE